MNVKSEDLKHVHHGSPKLNYIPFIIMRARWRKKIKKKIQKKKKIIKVIYYTKTYISNTYFPKNKTT
jgi:hypothetical protein